MDETASIEKLKATVLVRYDAHASGANPFVRDLFESLIDEYLEDVAALRHGDRAALEQRAEGFFSEVHRFDRVEGDVLDEDVSLALDALVDFATAQQGGAPAA